MTPSFIDKYLCLYAFWCLSYIINHQLTTNWTATKKLQKKSCLSNFILVTEMMKKLLIEKKIPNKILNRVLLEQNVVAGYESVEKEDKQACNQQDIDDWRYCHLFLNEIKGHYCGTERELDLFVIHVCKGYLEDPFDDIHIALNQDVLCSYSYRLRGSSSLESTNKQVNKLVHEVSRMSTDYCNKKNLVKNDKY